MVRTRKDENGKPIKSYERGFWVGFKAQVEVRPRLSFGFGARGGIFWIVPQRDLYLCHHGQEQHCLWNGCATESFFVCIKRGYLSLTDMLNRSRRQLSPVPGNIRLAHVGIY
jgi:hypothetical protein